MRKQHPRSWIIQYACVFIIICTFAVLSILLLKAGVQVYKNIAFNSQDNFEQRTSLSFVATKIRQCDEKGKISIQTHGDIKTLVLEEEYDNEKFETYLYFWDGGLYELFQEKGAEFDVNYGTYIMDIYSFDIEWSDNKMLQLTAENKQGIKDVLCLKLRSDNSYY